MRDKEKNTWSEVSKELGGLIESWKQEDEILASFKPSNEVPDNYLDECIFNIIEPFREQAKRSPITIALENLNIDKHLLDSDSKYKGFTFRAFTEQELNELTD